MAFQFPFGGGDTVRRLDRARARKWPDSAEIDRLRVKLGEEIVARPDWLPEIARPPEAKARNRRGRIVHVVGLTYPVAPLMESEVKAGWLPVTCTPVQPTSEPLLRDGAWLVDEHGGKANRLIFSGLRLEEAPADLLLSCEATLHARALERLGCDVIHVNWDAVDSGTVLVGMALARRFGAPLVAELAVPATPPRWRLTRETGRSVEDRLIAAAGAIIVQNEAEAERVAKKGADRAHLFIADGIEQDGHVSGPSLRVYEHARSVYRSLNQPA